MPKTTLRSTLLRQRRQLSALSREAWGRRAQQRLLGLPVFDCAQMVGLYSPIHNEAPTALLFRAALRRRKRLLYPRVDGLALQWVEVSSSEDLRRGAFGILEPPAGEVRSLAEIDLLVIPGVAFDRRGHRLGYGKGYYDRLLQDGFRGVLVGLCFDFQLLPELPEQPHDVPVDWVVTEAEVIAVHRSRYGRKA